MSAVSAGNGVIQVGVERGGVVVTGVLPDDTWDTRWDEIVVEEGLKSRLLSYGLFAVTQRSRFSAVALPLHGLALLAGPPGTGKTTLAHGLANEIARHLAKNDIAQQCAFAVVDVHAFPSQYLGESPRAVARLFSDTIPSLASKDVPLFVLLDEVEALAMSRSRASFDTNPVDVHRATDAVIVGLDLIARRCPNVLLIATTNDRRAVDDALLSRVDVEAVFDLPKREAIETILAHTLESIGMSVSEDPGLLKDISLVCENEGLDARRVRKLVLEAVISNGPDLALSPENLSLEHLKNLFGGSSRAEIHPGRRSDDGNG